MEIKLRELDETLAVGRILSQSHGLIGQGTKVFTVQNSGRWKGQELTSKLSYPPASRMSEAQLVALARDHAVGEYRERCRNLPKIFHSEGIQGCVQELNASRASI
jgi:hypothetical protein